MIYPCPHCQTDLKIHSVHFGKELSCPECEKSFTVEEVPPVIKYEPKEIGFFQVFKVVLYTLISILITSAVCIGAYSAAKKAMPSFFKKFESEPKQPTLDQIMTKLERTVPERTVIYIREPASAPERSGKPLDSTRGIRQKNADAENDFLQNLNIAPGKK